MKKNIEELYIKGDSHTGENIYYIDKECTQPYTGWVIEIFQGKLSWEFQTKNGEQNGLEKVYNEDGSLQQIDEYQNNFQYGISKEYNEKGELTSVAIVWNNGYLKTIYINGNEINKIDIDNRVENQNLPEKISYLFTLSNEELINYKFE